MLQVSDSGELYEHSHNALFHIAFPIVVQGRHSRTVISELNTVPMHTPTNASPRHHWSSTHIDFHIFNFTALSVGILDDVLNVRLTLIPPSGLVKFNI